MTSSPQAEPQDGNHPHPCVRISSSSTTFACPIRSSRETRPSSQWTDEMRRRSDKPSIPNGLAFPHGLESSRVRCSPYTPTRNKPFTMTSSPHPPPKHQKNHTLTKTPPGGGGAGSSTIAPK